MTCFINGCFNKDDKKRKLSFYSFPNISGRQHTPTETGFMAERHAKEQKLLNERRSRWLTAINRKEPPSKSAKVCSDHFISGKPAPLWETTNPDWVPSLLLHSEDSTSQENLGAVEKKIERYNRVRGRNEKKQVLQEAKENTSQEELHKESDGASNVDMEEEKCLEPRCVRIENEKELLERRIEQLEKDLDECWKEVSNLKGKINLDIELFRGEMSAGIIKF